MNRWLRRTCVLAMVAVVPIVGLTAAPAGAKTVAPQKWATGFCTAFGDWQNDINQLQSDLNDQLSAITTGSSAAGTASEREKRALDDFLGQTVAATDKAITRVKAAGVPATTNGKQISKAMVNALAQARKIFAAAQTETAGLDTSDPAKFATDTNSIAAEISSSGDQVTSAFSQVNGLDKGGKLGKVVKAQRACAFLKSSA